jgi:hypothetical protein
MVAILKTRKRHCSTINAFESVLEAMPDLWSASGCTSQIFAVRSEALGTFQLINSNTTGREADNHSGVD